MRVLLVENETAIANIIADGLKEEDFVVDVAHNGKEGTWSDVFRSNPARNRLSHQ